MTDHSSGRLPDRVFAGGDDTPASSVAGDEGLPFRIVWNITSRGLMVGSESIRIRGRHRLEL